MTVKAVKIMSKNEVLELAKRYMLTKGVVMNKNTADVAKQHIDALKNEKELAVQRIKQRILQGEILSYDIINELNRLRKVTGNPIYKGWFLNKEIICPDCNANLEVYKFYTYGEYTYRYQFALCNCGFIWGRANGW